MKLNPKFIEKQATLEIESMANKSMKINTDINNNDTKISFDGEMEVYESEDMYKSNFMGKVQVQIKGKQVSKKGKKLIRRHGISMNDLKAYQKEGGVYYFVVYIVVGENDRISEKQVYGRQLHQLNLQYLLQKKQKTITIEMYEIEDESILYENCVEYINEKRRQSQVGQIEIKKTDNIPTYISTPENIVLDYRGFPLNDFYGYMKINSTVLDATIPKELLSMENITLNNKRQIVKEGKVVFEGLVSIIISKESTSIIIDDIFKLQTFENGSNSKYTMLPFKTLNVGIKSFEIIKELSKGGKFTVGNIELSIEAFDINIAKIEKLVNELNNELHKDKLLLNFNEELKWKDFNKQMVEMSGLLELLKNKSFENFRMNENAYYKVKFGGKDLLLFKYGEAIYNVYSYEFLNKFTAFIKGENEEIEMSMIYILTREMIVDILNFDIDVIKKIVENDNISYVHEVKWEKLNNFSLELIAAYDKTKKIDLLELAEYILKALNNSDNDKMFMNLINREQIIRRKHNTFDQEILGELLNLEDKLININREIAMLHINVVSGSKQEAKIRYKNLSSTDLEMFNAYPIFNLYKDLIES